MAKVQEKQNKPGRNDPCWCGSGKKYKDCHLPLEDAQRTEQRKLRQAQDTLFPKIMEATQSVPEALPAALACFWQDKYSLEQMSILDEREDRGADRFLTWLAFDYRLADGRTLVETLADATDVGDFAVDTYEARLLHAWTGVRLRPYVIEAVRKSQGLTVRDLLTERVCKVEDHAASRHVEVGEVLVGHLVPVGAQPGQVAAGAGQQAERLDNQAIEQTTSTAIYYVAGAVARLTSDTREALVEFANLHLEDVSRAQPDATLNDLPYQRSHIFNHFVMALPTEHTPGILDDVLLRTRTALHLVGSRVGKAEDRDGANDDTD